MRWLIISLLCFAGCGGDATPASGGDSAPPASGQSISWDFESGTFPPECPATPVVFPQVVLLEEGPHLHYGRMTATPADCGPNNFTTCPVTRAECLFNQMSVSNGQSLTFHVDLRLPTSGAAGSNAGPHKLMAWQIFANTSGGRSVWIGVSSSTRWYIANEMQPCANAGCTIDDPLFGDSLSLQMIDMGPVVYGQWESFDVTVNFNTAATGTVQVTKNGLVLGTMTGQATTISTSVAQQVYLNVLDAHGNLGIIDFDNLSMSVVQPPQ